MATSRAIYDFSSGQIWSGCQATIFIWIFSGSILEELILFLFHDPSPPKKDGSSKVQTPGLSTIGLGQQFGHPHWHSCQERTTALFSFDLNSIVSFYFFLCFLWCVACDSNESSWSLEIMTEERVEAFYSNSKSLLTVPLPTLVWRKLLYCVFCLLLSNME